MSPRVVRRIVSVVFVAGIGGMIAGSVSDNNGMAITFGLVTAVAALGLILVTSVAGPGAFVRTDRTTGTGPTSEPAGPVDERLAADVEARVQALVDAGAFEADVRSLVGRAVELGRSTRSTPARGT